MEFGELVEYNMRKFCLKNHTQNAVEKLFPEIVHISGSIVESFIQFLFIVCQVDDHRNILKLNYLLLPHIKLFKKAKRGLEYVYRNCLLPRL